jgi:hypothetical protein
MKNENDIDERWRENYDSTAAGGKRLSRPLVGLETFSPVIAVIIVVSIMCRLQST